MKKHIVFLIAIISLSGIYFVSCAPSAAEKEKARVKRQMTPNPISWDTIDVNKTQLVGLDSLGAVCTVDIRFIIPQQYEKAEVLRAIQRELNYALVDEDSLVGILSKETIDKYAADYIADYIEDAQKDYSLWHNMDASADSYTKDIRSEVVFDQANLISYRLKAVEYSGEDTTSVIYENLLFDLTDGRKLSEEDIFGEGYRDELNKMLTEQLLRANGVTEVAQLQDLGYWGAADIAANNNFYVTQDRITYTYNPGEYADPQLGVLNISINFSDLLLTGILKDDSPVSVLYKKAE